MTPATDELNEEFVQHQFATAGLKDPLRKWNARDATEQQEIQRIKDAQEEKWARFIAERD